MPCRLVAYGYNEREDEETIARCAALFEAYCLKRSEEDDVKIIIPSRGRTGQTIKDYLLGYGMSEDDIIFRPSGKNTFAETLIATEEINDDDAVYVCSSGYHLPRIKMLWWILAGRKVQIISARGGETDEEKKLEILKYGKDYVQGKLHTAKALFFRR